MIKKKFFRTLVRPALIAFLIFTVVARLLNYDYLMLNRNTLVPEWVLLFINALGSVLETVRIALCSALIVEAIHNFGTYRRSFGVRAALWSVLLIFVEWVSKFLLYLRMGEFIMVESTAIALYTISFAFESLFVIVVLVAYKLTKSGVTEKGGKNIPADKFAQIPRKAALITSFSYGAVALFAKIMDVVDFVITTDNVTGGEIVSMFISSAVTIVIYCVIGPVITHLFVKFFEKRLKGSAEDSEQDKAGQNKLTSKEKSKSDKINGGKQK